MIPTPAAAMLGLACLCLHASPARAQGNQSPTPPVILEPETDGDVAHPASLRMETGPFTDPDPGDLHACSDWEIYLHAASVRIWSAPCMDGSERLSVQLGDGTFEGSHAGRNALYESTTYRLRVRHSDDSADPQTQWSPWSERVFVTGDASSIYPLELADVGEAPPLAWVYEADGFDVELPGAATAPTLMVESAQGALLLEIAGDGAPGNAVTNPAALPGAVEVRLHLNGGSSGVNMPESNLSLIGDGCGSHEVLLPAIQLAPGQESFYWVGEAGATFVASPGQTDPDFSNLARGAMWWLRQPGYSVERFSTGLRMPVNIAFIPGAGGAPSDPFLYVTELYGKIRTIARDGTASDYATNLLNYNPTGFFPGSGEQGLTGIAVDPTSGDVFATMLYDAGGPHYPKIDRFTSLDGGRTAASQVTILDMFGESMGQSHQISHIEVADDDRLLVHLGDGFHMPSAQDLTSFRGKILRLNFDGSPAGDNPFYDPTDGIDSEDYVFAYGLRNPFGGARRGADDTLYQVENGPSVDRFGKVLAGRNFGWSGGNTSMQIFALFNWSPAVGPVNLAFVQPQTFGGSGFPIGKWDHAFVTESGPTYAAGPQLNGKRITEWVLDVEGELESGPAPFLDYMGSGRATCVGLAAGPEGLYFTDFYRDAGSSPTAAGASLWRVVAVEEVDCNQNGAHDACDIATGSSTDVDGDGVPDECACAGANFCQATPNSTGNPASISSNDRCIVADNAFVLTAGPVPDQPGIFFYGDGQAGGGAGVPFFDGFRCVGGTSLIRLPLVVGSGGQATFAVDFGSLPPAGPITPGSRRFFQFWFRDPGGGPTGVNLSDGLDVTFQ